MPQPKLGTTHIDMHSFDIKICSWTKGWLPALFCFERTLVHTEISKLTHFYINRRKLLKFVVKW